MNRSSTASDLSDAYSAHLREWASRFAAALEATGYDSVLIYAGEEQVVPRDDATYPFTAEPYFRVWAPLPRHPGSVIQIVPGDAPRLIYFQDASFWHEPPAEPSGEWLAHFDLRCVGNEAERAAAIRATRGRTAAIGVPGAADASATVVNDPALLAQLDFTRARKTPYEVACIEEANAIAAVGHRAAQQAYADDASEFAIDQVFCAATRQRIIDLPYRSIVALNEHASVLHYQNARHDRPGDPSSFLLDAGATCGGYVSDVTRTVARGSSEMQALIAAVDGLQQRICERVAVGCDFVALNELTHEWLAEVLHEAGLLKCSADTAFAEGITRTFLPHGLGHLLGLQVHDAGGRMVAPDGALRAPPATHPMLRLTRGLEPGFVVTIEPGLYFIPSLLAHLRESERRSAINWSAVERLAPFGGIRVEDDVLVTDTGVRNLSRPALEAAGVF